MFEKDKKPVDDNFRKVVTMLLDSPNKRVLAGAIEASGLLVSQRKKKPDKIVVAKLYELGRTHPTGPGRMEVLDAMGSITDGAKNEEYIDVVLINLEHSDPLVVVKASNCVWDSRGDVARPNKMRKVMKELLDHKDPAVRGIAATRWADLMANQKKDEEASERLAKMLKDEHPWVRAWATRAMSDVKYKAGIHKIFKHLLKDKKTNSISTMYTPPTPRTRRWGGRILWSFNDPVSASRVDVGWLKAIERLSRDMGDDKFKVRKLRSDVDEQREEIAAAIEDVDRWYKKNKDKF